MAFGEWVLGRALVVLMDGMVGGRRISCGAVTCYAVGGGANMFIRQGRSCVAPDSIEIFSEHYSDPPKSSSLLLLNTKGSV